MRNSCNFFSSVMDLLIFSDSPKDLISFKAVLRTLKTSKVPELYYSKVFTFCIEVKFINALEKSCEECKKYVTKLFMSCYKFYCRVNVCILKHVVLYLHTSSSGNICKTLPGIEQPEKS